MMMVGSNIVQRKNGVIRIYRLHAIMRDLIMERNSGRTQNFLRITDTNFEYFLQLVSPLIAKQETHPRKLISPKERRFELYCTSISSYYLAYCHGSMHSFD